MSRSIKILRTIGELQTWRSGLEPRATVGFAPTMGALHAGHAELFRQVRPRCDVSVASIFVNPAQFGPSEDLAKYPRTFDRDIEIAANEGVDAVFAPTSEMIYPKGYSTYVEELELTQPLCGKVRPGHFRGVTTVVLKLFNLVRPSLALFGLKDAQQFFVLHKMTTDLNLNVSVEGVHTVREPDGLALSSRNAYLTAEERVAAPSLYKALQRAASDLVAGAALKDALTNCTTRLAEAGFKPQYLECLALPALSAADALDDNKPYLLAVAAHLGTTRLIDNVIIRPERLRETGIRFV